MNNSSLFFEIFFIVATTVGAFFFARTHMQTPTRTLRIVAIIVGIALFGVDRLLWANTTKGIFDHLTCTALPDSLACTKDKSSDQATAQPAANIPATTQFSSSKELYNKGLAAYSAKDYVTARQLYKQACDGGNALGCINLGYMWQNGVGGDTYKLLARQLYKQACDGGNAMGCTSLGFMWETDEGGGTDKLLAQQLYKQGCDGGYAIGCYNLGLMWDNGIDGSTNKRLARQLYKKACDGGYADGCANLRRLTSAL